MIKRINGAITFLTASVIALFAGLSILEATLLGIIAVMLINVALFVATRLSSEVAPNYDDRSLTQAELEYLK